MAREAYTDTGGPEGRFPATRWSLVAGAADPESPGYRASIDSLASTYWRPVYAHFRRKWNRSNEEAKDLTQDFFTSLLEKGVLARLSSERGRFRSYVMAALDNFARLEHRRESAEKRGGGAVHVSLEDLEGFEPSATGSPEADFSRDWARSILAEALDEMEAEYREDGKETAFRLFLARDVEASPEDDTSYEALARRFGVSLSDVTNFLFRARKRLREGILARVRDTVASEADTGAEMQELFGS